MAGQNHAGNPWWTIVLPLLSSVLVIAYFAGLLPKDQPLLLAFETLLLCGTIFASVHHAEVVGSRVGEPFGSIILAISVTNH